MTLGKYFGELLVRKHSTIAGTLLAASVLGSFTYTVTHGRSAWLDATTMMSLQGRDESENHSHQRLYQLKFHRS